jgi:tRNA pseudouridine55 synthase
MVASVRRMLSEKNVGHLGTLDPAAQGLMVLAVGSKALKVVEFFNKLPKQYVAEVQFGEESTTYDTEGVLSEYPRKAGWNPPDDASRIQALLSDRFLGTISQVPPMHSAIHVGGERAYKKAMRGENVEMKARETVISECTILEYAYPRLTMCVGCSSGTYIRSLAHDLGQAMRCGAYLKSLSRTKVGDWSLDTAVAPEDVRWSDIVPLKDILLPLGGREMSDAEWKELQFGRSITGLLPACGFLLAWHQGLPVAILEHDKKREGMLKPRKVL